MRKWSVLVVLCACSATVATAQVGELSVSGGVSRFGGASLGSAGSTATDSPIKIGDGFRLNVRFTLNTYRFFGHEFGYAYNRSNIDIAGQKTAVPIHQGFYDFLVYATPEGSHVRPFAAGGVQFSSFFPPGSSVYYGNQVTKFGFNYGGGLKVRVTSVWGVRFDIRQYNSGKPFDFPFASGRLKQTEVTGGISFNF